MPRVETEEAWLLISTDGRDFRPSRFSCTCIQHAPGLHSTVLHAAACAIVRWTMWNTIFLVAIVQAHNTNPYWRTGTCHLPLLASEWTIDPIAGEPPSKDLQFSVRKATDDHLSTLQQSLLTSFDPCPSARLAGMFRCCGYKLLVIIMWCLCVLCRGNVQGWRHELQQLARRAVDKQSAGGWGHPAAAPRHKGPRAAGGPL